MALNKRTTTTAAVMANESKWERCFCGMHIQTAAMMAAIGLAVLFFGLAIGWYLLDGGKSSICVSTSVVLGVVHLLVLVAHLRRIPGLYAPVLIFHIVVCVLTLVLFYKLVDIIASSVNGVDDIKHFVMAPIRGDSEIGQRQRDTERLYQVLVSVLVFALFPVHVWLLTVLARGWYFLRRRCHQREQVDEQEEQDEEEMVLVPLRSILDAATINNRAGAGAQGEGKRGCASGGNGGTLRKKQKQQTSPPVFIIHRQQGQQLIA